MKFSRDRNDKFCDKHAKDAIQIRKIVKQSIPRATKEDDYLMAIIHVSFKAAFACKYLRSYSLFQKLSQIKLILFRNIIVR